MEAQTAISVAAGRNYVQLRIRREPEPFFFCIHEEKSSPAELVGEVVDHRGQCLKPNEKIPRKTILKTTRAIMDDGLFPQLIPVKPISPAGGRR